METSKDIHEGVSFFSCLLCDSVLDSNEELMNHLKCHNSEKPFSCTECDKKYTYKTALKKHLESHKTETFELKCNECDYKCTNKRNLCTPHVLDTKFKCDKCDFISVSNSSLSKHKRIENHKNKYECNDCSVLFDYKST